MAHHPTALEVSTLNVSVTKEMNQGRVSTKAITAKTSTTLACPNVLGADNPTCNCAMWNDEYMAKTSRIPSLCDWWRLLLPHKPKIVWCRKKNYGGKSKKQLHKSTPAAHEGIFAMTIASNSGNSICWPSKNKSKRCSKFLQAADTTCWVPKQT